MSLYLGENLISGQATLVGESRNVGQIIPSAIPLTDAGLHLLDGALLQYGSYQAFIDYIADLYADNPTASYFAQPSDASWVQPVLSSNGTMGGDSFAVSSNVVQLSGCDVWCAFDGVTSGGNYFHSQSGTKTGYIDIYNPVPIKITNFKIYNQNASSSANRASSAGVIYGSDNGSDWTQLSTYTNDVQTVGGTWNIDLSLNENYYKYYRMESTAGGSASYWAINEIQITAIYQQTAEEVWQTAVSTYGVCGKFVYNSTNNTVRLPKYSDKIFTQEFDATTPVVGNGELFNLYSSNENNSYPLFTYSQDGHPYNLVRNIAPSGNLYVSKDATKSGLMAQLSDITTSLDGYYYIVIATTTKTDIEVDIDDVVTDLNGKADVDLSNINASQSAKDTIIGWGMPDYSSGIGVSIPSNAFSYSCPNNGIITIKLYGSGNSDTRVFVNGSTALMARSGTGAVATTISGCFPVSKGDIVSISGATSFGDDYHYMFFYPLKGAN